MANCAASEYRIHKCVGLPCGQIQHARGVQLVLKTLFSADYGMYTYNEESRTFWFRRESMEAPEEYRLLGMLMGIALYNGVNLDLRFPPVVYKKLLAGKTKKRQQPSTRQSQIEDLRGVDPRHRLQGTL